MMRGKNCWAVGVREPDGALFAQTYPLSKKGNRPAWFSWPLVRGCVALVDSLALGFKALEIAANKAFDDEEDDEVTVAAEASRREPEVPKGSEGKDTKSPEEGKVTEQNKENGSFEKDADTKVKAGAEEDKEEDREEREVETAKRRSAVALAVSPSASRSRTES